jgi:hypothetical protein
MQQKPERITYIDEIVIVRSSPLHSLDIWIFDIVEAAC